MDVINHNLKNLKAQLPKQYARLIAMKLEGMSADQVRNVFDGRTTNPDTVLKVVTEAKKLLGTTQMIGEVLETINEEIPATPVA